MNAAAPRPDRPDALLGWMGSLADPTRVRLLIELQPETATQRWHAVVRDADGRLAFKSGSPLELVRHLARWTRPDGRAHGLR